VGRGGNGAERRLKRRGIREERRGMFCPPTFNELPPPVTATVSEV